MGSNKPPPYHGWVVMAGGVRSAEAKAPKWVLHGLHEVIVPIALLIGGIEVVLLFFYVHDKEAVDLVLAVLVAVGLPWVLVLVPRGWRGTWSLEMTIQGPDSQSEGVLLWRAICDGLGERGIGLAVGATQTRLAPVPQTESSAYVREHRTRIRLVNTFVHDPHGQPLLSSHLVLEPDDRPNALLTLRSALTEILVAERMRYREEAMRKGIIPRPLGHNEAGKA